VAPRAGTRRAFHPNRDLIVLLLRASRLLARLDPRLCPGRWLHRRGLAVLAAGAPGRALGWLEAAGDAYRRELAVAPLARLRVHELMARANAGGRVDSAALVELVRRLNRLEQLERLVPPFELADARVVLGEWLERADNGRGGDPAVRLQAA
jgi:hypothetical protein